MVMILYYALLIVSAIIMLMMAVLFFDGVERDRRIYYTQKPEIDKAGEEFMRRQPQTKLSRREYKRLIENGKRARRDPLMLMR